MGWCAPIGVWQGNIEHLTEESNFQFWKLKWHILLTTTLQTRGLPCLLWFYKFWKIRCIHILIFFGSMWNFRRLPLQHLFIFCWKPWLEQIRDWQGSSRAWNFLVAACSLIMASKSSAILPITFESPIRTRKCSFLIPLNRLNTRSRQSQAQK